MTDTINGWVEERARDAHLRWYTITYVNAMGRTRVVSERAANREEALRFIPSYAQDGVRIELERE